MWIIFLILGIFLFFILWKLFKIPKYGNMLLITGGIKTGKSMLSAHIIKREYSKRCVKIFFVNLFGPFLSVLLKHKKFEKKPYPLIYSNVPLRCKYVPITVEELKRNKRFVYGSIVYLCESSLVCDSMYYKDEFTNEQLLLFSKLFAHETHGGLLVLDTQSISDNHFAFKRCLSSYFYIHHCVKLLFFNLLFVRELHYSEDNSTVNNFDSDVEESLKMVVVPKSVYKLYDRYTYSILTDNLPYNDVVIDGNLSDDLKSKDIISFKKFKHLYGGNDNEV